MKKTYLAKRNSLLAATRFSWGSAALGIALVALALRVLAPNLFLTAATPLFSVSDTLAGASRGFFSGFIDAAKVRADNAQLVRENAALATQNEALTHQVASFLSTSDIARSAGITAGVVMRPPLSPYDTLVVAQGSRAGVTPHMEAYGTGGVPLGTVESVTSDFSRVVLFSSPGRQTLGWVGGGSLPVTLKGAGGGAFSASVNRAAAISVGDTVFLPGPGMLPVGKVTRIDDDPSAPSVTLRVTPSLNLFSLGWVLLRSVGADLFTSVPLATTTRP